MMSLKPQPPRPMPPDIANWGATELPPDDPYRQIGDTLYAELHAAYAADLAVIPAPANLTTFDLAVIFTLQQLEHLTADEAATRVRTDQRWTYALHLPLLHPGCTGRDLKTFRKRLEVHQPPRIVQFFLVRAAIRQVFPTAE
jgi:hypothetical protein